jgi:hypothetical protein
MSYPPRAKGAPYVSLLTFNASETLRRAERLPAHQTFFDTRAISSSVLERKSLRRGELFAL